MNLINPINIMLICSFKIKDKVKLLLKYFKVYEDFSNFSMNVKNYSIYCDFITLYRFLHFIDRFVFF